MGMLKQMLKYVQESKKAKLMIVAGVVWVLAKVGLDLSADAEEAMVGLVQGIVLLVGAIAAQDFGKEKAKLEAVDAAAAAESMKPAE